MNITTRSYVRALLQRATDESIQGHFPEAWQILEESHIISQPSASMHTLVHWRMLLLALKQRSGKEVWGQIIRLILAGPGSLLGKYPLGNTGRSNVNMFHRMSIPKEIADRIKNLSKENYK